MKVNDKVKCNDLDKCEDLTTQEYTIEKIVLTEISDFPFIILKEQPYVAYPSQLFDIIK